VVLDREGVHEEPLILCAGPAPALLWKDPDFAFMHVLLAIRPGDARLQESDLIVPPIPEREGAAELPIQWALYFPPSPLFEYGGADQLRGVNLDAVKVEWASNPGRIACELHDSRYYPLRMDGSMARPPYYGSDIRELRREDFQRDPSLRDPPPPIRFIREGTLELEGWTPVVEERPPYLPPRFIAPCAE
jgi:hypothetical protein